MSSTHNNIISYSYYTHMLPIGLLICYSYSIHALHIGSVICYSSFPPGFPCNNNDTRLLLIDYPSVHPPLHPGLHPPRGNLSLQSQPQSQPQSTVPAPAASSLPLLPFLLKYAFPELPKIPPGIHPSPRRKQVGGAGAINQTKQTSRALSAKSPRKRRTFSVND